MPRGISKRQLEHSFLEEYRIWLSPLNKHYFSADSDSPASTAHDPNTTFLMREFLQVLVFLADFIYNGKGLPTSHPSNDTLNGRLSRHLSELISTHILPLAGSFGELLYGQGRENTELTMSYKEDVWRLFENIRNKVH